MSSWSSGELPSGVRSFMPTPGNGLWSSTDTSSRWPSSRSAVLRRAVAYVSAAAVVGTVPPSSAASAYSGPSSAAAAAEMR